jgi:hypothetical protein
MLGRNKAQRAWLGPQRQRRMAMPALTIDKQADIVRFASDHDAVGIAKRIVRAIAEITV